MKANPSKPSNLKVYLAAVIYTVIVGLSFIFVKLTLTVSHPLDSLAHRFTIAFIAASIPVALGWLKLSINFKDILSILPLAVLYPALFFTFQAFGLVHASSSEAGIIHATVPIFTLILAAYILKERTTIWQKLATLLSVSGVIFMFLMKGISLDTVNATGSILILLSALCLALYSVLARKLTRKFKAIELTYVMIGIAFVGFNGLSVTRHISEGTLTHYFEPFTSWAFIGAILYLSVLSSLVTSFLSNYTLAHMEASKLSVFNNVSTLVTILAGVLFLQEQLKWYHLIGVIMILAGVVGTNFLKPRKRKATESDQGIST
ncbi:putative DMT superfamily transporter inner membrane protein [compost metagenome]